MPLYNTASTGSFGYGNTGVGYYALYTNTTGGYNAALAINRFYANTIGQYNAALGTEAGKIIQRAASIFRGYQSLYTNQEEAEIQPSVPTH